MIEIRVSYRSASAGKFTVSLVDDEDAPKLERYSWRLTSGGYAERFVRKGSRSMHRIIMGLAKGDPRQVDHINGERLDNRKANLRLVNGQAEQMQNRRPNRGSSSGHRGVTLHRKTGKWQAQAEIGGKCFYLGLFGDVREAAEAARLFRTEHMPLSVESRLP